MMVERYPDLKEEGGSSIPGYEISSPLDRINLFCQVVVPRVRFGASLLAFCLETERKKKKSHVFLWWE